MAEDVGTLERAQAALAQEASRALVPAATLLLLGLGLLGLWVLAQPVGVPTSSPVLSGLGLSDATVRQLPVAALAAVVVMAIARFQPKVGGLFALAIVLLILLQYEGGV